jgi:hypothetical protein
MSEAAFVTRPRVWRLQFSLRLLLLSFTAFAIGFPIWYRWPYRETVEQRDPAGRLSSTRIITWQRQWGGDRLEHGIAQTTRIVAGTPFITITTYARGKRHGPYSARFTKTQFSETGQYRNDMKEGRWITEHGEDRIITRWHYDLRDGETEIIPKRGAKTIATFAAGRLVKFNGKPVDDPLFDRLKSGTVVEHIAAELTKETNIDMVEMPLKDVMMFVGDLHNIPVVVDPRGDFPTDLPITATYRGMDLQSALVLLLAPQGMACDFRYGALWVTKADKVKDWRDPTGIAEIKPPSGSALARAWDEPIAVDGSAPLKDTAAYIEQKMGVSIDASRVKATPEPTAIPIRAGKIPSPFTPTIRNQPLRHALGHVLYNSGFRCMLEGETLVILSPEE